MKREMKCQMRNELTLSVKMHHSCFAVILLCFLTACHLNLSLAGPRNLCVLPAAVGSCQGYFPKWFYNTTSARCETFIYGGCQGNPNRFDTKESCESTCVCDRCILQPDTGLCRARIPSYFYNTASSSCEQFNYGGCDGNDNRFTTAADCAHHCYSNASCPVKGQVFENCPSCQGTCDNPVVLACPLACTGGSCVCPPGQLVDTEANECVHPSQCPVKCLNIQCPKVNCFNGNATTPPGSCCPVCVCKDGDKMHLPGEPFKKDCNFCSCTPTGLSICTEIACQETSSPPTNKTRCPIEGQEYTECGTACPLTCKALDPVPCTRQCVPGCQCPRGTILDEDNKRCVEHCLIPPCQRVMCTLQPETGPCRAFIESYFWNATTRQCERFTYGGCGGNFNRFSDMKSCSNQCACVDHKCNKGSYCKVHEPTGRPYCEASCDLNNGGCPANKTCSLHNVTCVQAPCPPVVNCTDRDPCEYHECLTGSKCKVFETTGETYCEPSCDLDNGGCAANQTCSLQVVQCIRAPCPPAVKCQAKCPTEGQEYTNCGTACPPTCSEPKPRTCTQQCVPGCQCPSDSVLDEVQNKCVKDGQCTCPPTCSHEYCSRRRNRKKPCSRPPPHSVSACPDQCRSTYCDACYYSKRRRNTPQKCNNKVCTGEEVTRNCLRRWAKCVNKQNGRKNKCDGDCITSENFQCYDYPPCSNLLG